MAYCVPLNPIVEAGLALMPVKSAAKAWFDKAGVNTPVVNKTVTKVRKIFFRLRTNFLGYWHITMNQ
jgi:hypothetical protein